MIDPKEFAELMPHDKACFTLGLLADYLGIEKPEEPKMVPQFLTNIVNTAKNNHKRANELQVVMDAHKVLHGGR